jgi:hypothetical protein
LLLSRIGPPGVGLRCGSAQLSSSVGKLAEAATAAPIPAVLKKDLRESMAGIVLWAAEKINHKGTLTTKDTKEHDDVDSWKLQLLRVPLCPFG